MIVHFKSFHSSWVNSQLLSMSKSSAEITSEYIEMSEMSLKLSNASYIGVRSLFSEFLRIESMEITISEYFKEFSNDWFGNE